MFGVGFTIHLSLKKKLLEGEQQTTKRCQWHGLRNGWFDAGWLNMNPQFTSNISILPSFRMVCRKIVILPSGKLTVCYGKSPFLMVKSTISMSILVLPCWTIDIWVAPSEAKPRVHFPSIFIDRFLKPSNRIKMEVWWNQPIRLVIFF